jgi:hypothetical protein
MNAMPYLPSRHGSVRGSADTRRSRTFEGVFGRMFRSLPPAEFKEEDLMALGDKMTALPKPDPQPDPGREPAPGAEDPDDNPEISAGYTYLGQFIDHDLNFDPMSSLQRFNDPEALVDFRTPRFDLDSLYGRGPDDQPYLYGEDGVHMLLGKQLDNGRDYDILRIIPNPADPVLERTRAILGDPRNDENVIIAQLTAIFLRFHNRLADELNADLATVQQLVRWHYQWVVLYDFLRLVVNPQTYAEVLPHFALSSNLVQYPPQLRFYKPRNKAFIPVEFSGAAYRFAHSMVRPAYRLNMDADPRVGGPFAIMGKADDPPSNDLRGFRPFNTSWAIDWGLFFRGVWDSEQMAPFRVQPAHKICTSLAAPLGALPFKTVEDMPSLAQRDLIRGWRLELPSGQAVAKAMGETPLTDAELQADDAFQGNAPLWYYVLAEAQSHPYDGAKLGPVGGRIVMETFVGLLMEDGHSFLRQEPRWTPLTGPFAGFRNAQGEFGMAEFVKAATS